MSTRSRPIHSGFESLRINGLSPRTTQGYHHFASVTNEQLSARALAGVGRITRPAAIFADFRER